MKEQPEVLRLAEFLEAGHTTQYNGDKAAAELRRLHAENETLKQSVARLQQHHATAWNRGHTMGMKANEDTARRALDAVKQDAWGNTQLTEALLKAEAQRDALRAELKEATEAIDDPAVNNLRTLPESIRVLCAQRDALLAACKAYDQWADKTFCYDRELRPIRVQIRAAIKAVEGEKT